MNENTRFVADALHEAARHGDTIPPVRDFLPRGDLASAYAVQRLNSDRLLHTGHRLSGRKVGLTSLAVQQQLGVSEPDFGMLFADRAFGDGEQIPWHRVIQPRCEAEVALVMDRELTSMHTTPAELLLAVAYVLPAIEVVDSRISDWNVDIVDTIADNASAGHYVIGNQPVALGGLDLRLAGMVMERDGRCVSTGVGAACLGHPLNAALWAARALARSGVPLLEGDVLLTGALGPMVKASPGDTFEVTIQALGSIRVHFGSTGNQTR